VLAVATIYCNCDESEPQQGLHSPEQRLGRSSACACACAAFLRSNGVIHRTQKVIQGDDNGHVGRPAWTFGQQLVFISGENPFVPGHRDHTVPVNQI
jgi:hypothetical protein